MMDDHKREVNYLRISVTDRCNLRCIYCMPKEGISLLGHEDILRYEEIIRIVKVAIELGIRKARVTGGEPLARKGVVNFIRSLSCMPGLEDVSMTTNGVLLGDLSGQLRDAGLRRVNISLDSLQPGRYAQITRGET